MAVAARRIEVEITMEERLARLEAQSHHTREDLRRIEGKVDSLDEKIDALENKMDSKIATLDRKIDSVREALEHNIHTVKDALVAFQLEMLKSRMADRVWALLIAGALLGVLARGFHWI